MKNKLAFGIIFIVLGLLIAFGPQTIFPICNTGGTTKEDSHGSDQSGMKMSVDTTEGDAGTSTMPSMTSHMRCYYTGQAELVVGLILSVVGLLFILIPNKKVQFALAIALALGGIIAFLIPTVLVGVCKSSRMTCRALTLPSLLILSGFVILLSVIHTIILYKTERGGHKSNETQSVDNGTTIGI